MSCTEEQRAEQSAMILMGCWGSQSSLDKPWEGYGYHCDAFIPDGFADADTGLSRADECHCHTVLHCGWSEPRVPAGYRLAVQFNAGEHECPDCSESCRCEESPKTEDCTLCEGSGYIYWGEDWSVCVFAPIDPDETLEAMRKLIAVRDETGQMWDDQQGRKLARLFADLDAYMTEGNEAPRGWQ